MVLLFLEERERKGRARRDDDAGSTTGFCGRTKRIIARADADFVEEDESKIIRIDDDDDDAMERRDDVTAVVV